MSDIIDVKAVDSEKAESLKTVGWISYLLHLVVAVAAGASRWAAAASLAAAQL